MMAYFRPNRSEIKPETNAPSQEPAGMAAVIPPCRREVGPEHVALLLNGGPSGPWLK